LEYQVIEDLNRKLRGFHHSSNIIIAQIRNGSKLSFHRSQLSTFRSKKDLVLLPRPSQPRRIAGFRDGR
jgi:hypothetical protein